MPVKRCISKGKKGYKWGDEGKCFIGSDGKVKAAKQGIAAATKGGYKISKEELNKLYAIAKGK